MKRNIDLYFECYSKTRVITSKKEQIFLKLYVKQMEVLFFYWLCDFD